MLSYHIDIVISTSNVVCSKDSAGISPHRFVMSDDVTVLSDNLTNY